MLNTFQPEIVILLNTLSLSLKKVCVCKTKLVYWAVSAGFSWLGCFSLAITQPCSLGPL